MPTKTIFSKYLCKMQNYELLTLKHKQAKATSTYTCPEL